MRKILSLFIAALFAGSMLASDAQKFSVQLDLSKGVFTAASGDDNPAYITWTAANGNITIKQIKAKSQTAVNSNYVAAPRIYGGQILEFIVAEGYSIDTIFALVGVGDKKNAGNNPMLVGTSINAADTVVASNSTDFDARFTYKASANDTIILKNAVSHFYWQNGDTTKGNQLRPSTITIAYTKAASSTPEISAGDVAFGTYVPGISEAQKLTVIGDNLSAAITATLTTGTAFTVTGDLTAAGGELTISVKATADGDYSDELTLTSGTTTKKVNVTAHLVNTSGKGTKDQPFSVQDVAKLNHTLSGNFWVEGFIIGGIRSGKINNEDSTAMALAAKMEAPEDTLQVQLPSKSNIRKELNVPNNNSIGWKVKILGSLEVYNNAIGLKSPTDFEIIEKSEPAKSNDASIKSLTIKGVAVTADANNVFAYEVPANENIAEVEVVFTLAAKATADKESPFKLAVPASSEAAASEATINVTAEDGTTKKAYKVSVTRAAAEQGIEDVLDANQAVKFIENGQLVIIKGGVRYNVLGTQIR